jgi:hypothetical protein
MAEKSLFWFTNGFTGATGDGSAPYTQDEFSLYNRDLLGEGVVYGSGNNLAVSGTATPLDLETGRAQVRGFSYWNSSASTLAVTTPTTGTTGGRVVLRADYSAATVRAVVKLNTDGNAGIPALTQVANTTWEISLATFTVTTGGGIAVTDTREFTRPLQRREVILNYDRLPAGTLAGAVVQIPEEYDNVRIVFHGFMSSTAVHSIRFLVNGSTDTADYNNDVGNFQLGTGNTFTTSVGTNGIVTFFESNFSSAGSFSGEFNLFNIKRSGIATGRAITSTLTKGAVIFFGQHQFVPTDGITSIQMVKRTGNTNDEWTYTIYGVKDELPFV